MFYFLTDVDRIVWFCFVLFFFGFGNVYLDDCKVYFGLIKKKINKKKILFLSV